MKPYIIGLTGGIASGKTAAGKAMESLGAKIIDADVVSRKVTEAESEGFMRLKEAFPNCVDGDKLDRKRLKSMVFSDREKLQQLNSLTWTLIEEEIRRQIAKLSESDTAVLVVPLLFESGLDVLADVVVTVSADERIRLRRVISRDGVDEKTALSVINAQMSDAEREKRSDYVLDGNGELSSLEAEAKELYARLANQ